MLNQDIATEICLLKGNDVARVLNISRAFAYQLMRQGEIPTVRIGNAVRVRKEDLLAYIDHNRRNFGLTNRIWPE
ncbi:MAG TPA: helix-turn-helix domain-containing protein [Anaerolineaceae bacterium]|jgi:excisionase family DNA binding protein|nr:helix-turn-helix domain-containing protein [Anaerolineaceae bacterium]HQI50409.1 helix-turn-helix domain-containing protein [bacterium]HUM62403.1 helix-turn-helix domain-containing protein [Anaerolineaceae bacterium]